MAIKKLKDEYFLALTSRLRTRMEGMLNTERIERLVTAPDSDDVCRQLTEYGYPDMSGMDIKSIDNILNTRRCNLFTEIAYAQHASGLVDIFRLKYDYHNIKVLVKSEGSAVNLLSGAGRVPPEKIINCYIRHETIDLPKPMHKAFLEARDILARTGSTQLSDIAIDKAYFAELATLADNTGSRFLMDYVRVMIDSANLRTAVRSQRMKKPLEFIRGAMIEGGTVTAPTAAAAYADGTIAELYECTKLRAAAEISKTIQSGGSLTEFERACDDAVSDFMSDSALIAFGAEPVAAYLAHFENELMSVRIILTGKLSGASPEAIRERLRTCHV